MKQDITRLNSAVRIDSPAQPELPKAPPSTSTQSPLETTLAPAGSNGLAPNARAPSLTGATSLLEARGAPQQAVPARRGRGRTGKLKEPSSDRITAEMRSVVLRKAFRPVGELGATLRPVFAADRFGGAQ